MLPMRAAVVALRRPVVVAQLARCGAGASAMSSKSGGEVDAEGLTRLFMAHDDAAAAAAPAAELPMKLTGRSGEIVAALYMSKGKDAAAYGKIVKGACRPAGCRAGPLRAPCASPTPVSPAPRARPQTSTACARRCPRRGSSSTAFFPRPTTRRASAR